MNECRSRQRRPWWRREIPAARTDLPELLVVLGEVRAVWEQTLHLLRALSPNRRAMLVLRYFEGLNDLEVAAGRRCGA